ncbi:uncharacterized protein LOC121789731 [Salvia splendens]|uniref:uncharacterized protein LOC121789731 n=1 Tax=Salvia splendens TaxID=180675 RepID=UPI001C27F38E|nr:uncharacterized protein LOC121789731 [Salvia splendens]
MTVLRSRGIPSAVKSELPQASAPRNVAAEPVTPPKTSEFVNTSMKDVCTPKEDVLGPEIGFVDGAGLVMVSESGNVRRVSARLAKKGRESVGVGSGKRKKVEGASVACVDTRNLKRRGCYMKLGAGSSVGNTEANIVVEVLKDSDGGDFMELLEDSVKIEDGVSAARLEFGCDINCSVRETRDIGQCKKKSIMEAKALGSESSEKDKLEKGFLSLRSGKRVPQRDLSDIRIGGDSSQGIQHSKNGGTYCSDDVPVKSISDAKSGIATRGRLSKEGKGKMKLDSEASPSSGIETVKLNVENVNGSSSSGVDQLAPDEVLPDEVQVRGNNLSEIDTRSAHRARFRNFAKRNASRFAHFSARDEFGDRAHDASGTDVAPPETSNRIEDWPGPFSTAMKIIKDRETNRNGGKHGGSTDVIETVELKWIPKNHESCRHQKHVPSLQDICLSILSRNADAITSLDFVPDALRHKICWFLCDNRSMDGHFLELLVHDTPTEIRIRDCSWLSEEQFVKIFGGCNTSKLTVLQFDQGGACMPDYVLHSTLARLPNSLPALTAISLKGAYRLSDAGLNMLASAAPSLKSVDISQCPLLTSEGICSLASSLRLVLRELYIDNSHGIDAMLILPALLMLGNLEVLSVAGILTVSDDFVSEFVSTHGSRMKELVLADCKELTDSSLQVIGDKCANLQAIDLTNLDKLTDISIGHLANGCQAIQMLKLCRNSFSDEAIAAYLDVNGAFLKCLSLNNVIQVSRLTALSLARNCKNLRSLDLSWCRNLTNEALGLIVDSCLLLEVLKLFGCTQVMDVFVDGHSNPQVKLIGLKMTPVFKHIEFPDFLLGPLRYPSASL